MAKKRVFIAQVFLHNATSTESIRDVRLFRRTLDDDGEQKWHVYRNVSRGSLERLVRACWPNGYIVPHVTGWSWVR